MKEIKTEPSLTQEQNTEITQTLEGKLKNTVDRSFYQNKQTWQQADTDRTLSIFRNAIQDLSNSSLEDLTSGVKDLISKNPLSFPDENLVAEVKRELREAIGEALRRAASKTVVTQEALTSLHEVLLDADLGLLKDVFGSNYIFQIANDILKSHHRVDQFEIYGTLSDIVGIHEEVVRDLKNDYLNYLSNTDPITSFLLKGESVVKELEKELELLVALAVGDEAGFKAQLASVSDKVKLAETKRALAKRSSNIIFAIVISLLTLFTLNLVGADFLMAFIIALGIGLGFFLLTS